MCHAIINIVVAYIREFYSGGRKRDDSFASSLNDECGRISPT
jgi:hypothetical protein